jgi:hypothetical protein
VDSIKHAHQLIMALLKNSESELMNLLPSSRSTTVISNHDNEDEVIQMQRTTTGPRLRNNGKER